MRILLFTLNFVSNSLSCLVRNVPHLVTTWIHSISRSHSPLLLLPSDSVRRKAILHFRIRRNISKIETPHSPLLLWWNSGTERDRVRERAHVWFVPNTHQRLCRVNPYRYRFVDWMERFVIDGKCRFIHARHTNTKKESDTHTHKHSAELLL